MAEPLALFRDDAVLKAHAAYRSAKSGDVDAAIDLIRDIAPPLLCQLIHRFPAGTQFVAPHALEAAGENAIPTVLATACAVAATGHPERDIVQTNRVFHTGADPMERLNARSCFIGKVRAGINYVLVDDVTTMGGTLADLADHIGTHGGLIAGAVVLVNAARSGRLQPDQRTVNQIERRFGDVIRDLFTITPAALTAEEAGYLIGFRDADEIRGRSLKAEQETHDRLRARRLRQA